MATGTKGEARAAAEIFGAGASASSSSKKDRLASGGDANACKGVKDTDTNPPNGCGAVLRLELQALSDKAPNVDPKQPLPNTCPDGFLWGTAGSCVRKAPDASYVCDMTDPQECKDQCKKGNAGSCFNAGTIAAGHGPDPVTRALFKKACDGNVRLGCYQWGKYAEGPEWPAAEAAFRKGCARRREVLQEHGLGRPQFADEDDVRRQGELFEKGVRPRRLGGLPERGRALLQRQEQRQR